MRSNLLSAPAAALLAALAAPPALGQAPAPRFYVSTTSDVAPGGGVPEVQDGDVALIQEGAPARVVLAAGHWLACAGDDLGDVDALARRPNEAPGSARSIAFSTLSNVAGVRDGDVLGLVEGGGIEVLVPEEAFTGPLGLPAGSLDVDALAFDELGRALVSFQDNETGTTIGDVADGDVFRLEPGGALVRVLTEADVEAQVQLATGASDPIGDVIGLDASPGSIAVTVQSPSAYDGAVIALGATPGLLATDQGAGLGGAELDALMRVEDADLVPVVRTTPSAATGGATVGFVFQGEPGAHLLVLYAGGAGFVAFPGLGFGGWYLDPTDLWLSSIFTGPTMPLVPLDATGTYTVDYVMPLGVEGVGLDGALGWSFQAMELGTLRVGAPYRLPSI